MQKILVFQDKGAEHCPHDEQQCPVLTDLSADIRTPDPPRHRDEQAEDHQAEHTECFIHMSSHGHIDVRLSAA